jgi:hypothetical protein
MLWIQTFCVRTLGKRAQTLTLAYRSRGKVEARPLGFFFFSRSLDSCARSRGSVARSLGISPPYSFPDSFSFCQCAVGVGVDVARCGVGDGFSEIRLLAWTNHHISACHYPVKFSEEVTHDQRFNHVAPGAVKRP